MGHNKLSNHGLGITNICIILLTTMNITSVVIMVIEINTFGNQLNKKMDLHNN